VHATWWFRTWSVIIRAWRVTTTYFLISCLVCIIKTFKIDRVPVWCEVITTVRMMKYDDVWFGAVSLPWPTHSLRRPSLQPYVNPLISHDCRFSPEDGNSLCLRNIDIYWWVCTTPKPKTSSSCMSCRRLVHLESINSWYFSTQYYQSINIVTGVMVTALILVCVQCWRDFLLMYL
jgi:hypothetical protein